MTGRVMIPIVSVTLRDGTLRYVKQRPLSSSELIDSMLAYDSDKPLWIETTQGFVRASEIVLIEDLFHEEAR